MESKEGPIWFELFIISIFLLFSIIAQMFIVVQILWTNWRNLRPIDIHQVNYFAGLALINISGIHLVISRAFDKPLDFCPSHLLSYIFLISNKYDIIILQLDRLFAIRKPYYYKEVVDFKISLKVVVLFKVISIIIAGLSSIIDPIFMYCPACGMCNYVQSIYLYTVSYPAIFVFTFTVIVSSYVFYIVNSVNAIQPLVVLTYPSRNMEPSTANQDSPINSVNLIQPLVVLTYPSRNMEPSTANQGSLNLRPANGLGLDLDKEIEMVQVENEDINICGQVKDSNIGTNKCFATNGNGVILSVSNMCQEDGDNVSLDEINVVKMLTEIETQKTANTVRVLNVEQIPVANETDTDKSMLTKTLKMNLFSLAVLFMTVPTSILNIIYENCNHLSGECDLYFDIMLVCSLCEIIISFLQPLVFLFFVQTTN